jgi:hypothetical protein
MATTPPSLIVFPPTTTKGGNVTRNEPLFQPNLGPFRATPVNSNTNNFVPSTNIVPLNIGDPYKNNKYTPTAPTSNVTPIGADIQDPPYSYNGPPKVVPVYKNLKEYLNKNSAARVAPVVNNVNISTLPRIAYPSVSTINKPTEVRIEDIQKKEDPNATSVNKALQEPNSNIGLVSKFFKNLSTWEGSIPLQHLWVVKFYFTNTFKTNFNSWFNNIISKGENLPWGQFDMGNINEIINNNALQGEDLPNSNIITGCYFARSVALPGERTDTLNPSIPGAGGLFFNNIINKRQAPSNLQVSFMETNASFVDLFLRPWSILSSYTGTVGRKDSLKVDVEAIFYSKNNIVKFNNYSNSDGANDVITVAKAPIYGSVPKYTRSITLDTHKDVDLVPRKRFYFKSVLPLNVNSQEYTQTGESLQIRPVDFIYESYKVSTYT